MENYQNNSSRMAKEMIDENNVPFYPVTHLSLVRDENGRTILDYINGGVVCSAFTEEDGLFFVDRDLNIGAYVNSDGIHSKTILNYQLIDE